MRETPDRESPTEDVALKPAIAIALAAVAAVLFAHAAAIQHSVVGSALGTADASRTLGMRRCLAILRTPAWLGGIALTAIGSALHVLALALAGVSIVQPVGVLAVPIGVLLAARASGRRPDGRVLACVALTVAGVAAFVLITALGAHSTQDVETLHIGLTSAVVAAAALALAGLGALGPLWVRCLAAAAAGAILYGLASALVRTVVLLLGHGRALDPWTLGILAAIIAMYAGGGWLVQQGYATGQAEVVLGCLTVLDPIVAVVFGIAFLGEGDRHGPLAVTGMVTAGTVAALGIVLLARHHRDARPGRAPRVQPPPPPAIRAEGTPP